jgi:hypothetical protein
MIEHANHIEFLESLSPADFNRELKQELTDSLQELVACIDQSLPQGDNTQHACVIDDFQVQSINLNERDCRVQIRFNASARQGIGAAKQLEGIVGRAEAVIDESSRVKYRAVTFAEEQTFVAHDLGGGD